MGPVKGKLTRLWTTGKAHSRNVYTGTLVYGSMPKVGARFILSGIDEVNDIVTSTIEKVNQDGDVFTFETRNSRYQLELL